MKKLTLEAGVKEDLFLCVILDLEEDTEQELHELHEWLVNIFQNEYKDVAHIKSMVSDEIWERYNLHNITGLREQTMLKQAQKHLKRIWSNPYLNEKQRARKHSKKRITKHKIIKDKHEHPRLAKNTESESDQSKESSRYHQDHSRAE